MVIALLDAWEGVGFALAEALGTVGVSVASSYAQ
jgi:hypothetical protein